MGLNLGQTLSSMGIIASRQREAENEVMRQRQLELQTQELNAQQRMRAEMGQTAQNLANTSPVMQFVQTPGAAYGSPEAPATPARPPAGVQVPAPAAAAPAPAPAPAAAAPAPAQPNAGLRTTAAPAGTRTPDQLRSVPTDQLTAAEFQLLPQADRIRRLQTENDRRQFNRIDAAGAKPPAAAFDIAALPITGTATLLEKGLNAIDLARWGRAAGIYDQDVTSVTVPGAGSLTPFYDRLRKAEAQNQPLTEAQLIAQLQAGDATRAKAAEAERTKNVATSQKEGYADWQLDAKGKPIRGLINNNPGNIRPDKAYTWQGSTGEAGGFVQFSSPEAGIRAMTMNLQSYNQRGIDTVQGIINRWAPESDNNKTKAYISTVAQDLGVKPTDRLNLQDANTLQRLVSSMIKMENGKNPYSTEVIQAGIAAGLNPQTQVAATQGSPIAAPAGSAPKPTRNVAAAVQTGTAQDVAEAVVESIKPASGGTMYGAGTLDGSIRNPVIQQALAVRKALQDQVATYNRYGRGDLAMEVASKIQGIDLGLYKSQADIGLYEGATTGNFSRAMSVLSTFTGAPHQVLQRSDGKGFDLYINGKVAKAGLKGDQVEMLVRTQVDAEYKKQLAAVQAERGKAEFESGLKIREKASEITLQAAKEIQKAVVEGNLKLAEENLKQSGFKLVGSSGGEGGIAYYSNGRGDVFVIDPTQKKVTINGTEVNVGAQAQRVSGVDRSIWSSVNAPSATVR